MMGAPAAYEANAAGGKPMGFQVAVDIGETFTDLIALDDGSGAILVDRSPSVPGHPTSSGKARGSARC